MTQNGQLPQRQTAIFPLRAPQSDAISPGQRRILACFTAKWGWRGRLTRSERASGYSNDEAMSAALASPSCLLPFLSRPPHPRAPKRRKFAAAFRGEIDKVDCSGNK